MLATLKKKLNLSTLFELMQKIQSKIQPLGPSLKLEILWIMQQSLGLYSGPEREKIKNLLSQFLRSMAALT